MIMYTFTPIYIDDNCSSKNAKVIIDWQGEMEQELWNVK